MFEPGRKELISDQHADLLAGLSRLNDELSRLTPEERAILKMSIDLVEYIKEYAAARTHEEWETMTDEQQKAYGEAQKRNLTARPAWFTVDEFMDTLICAGGVLLHDGHVVPRF